MSERKYREWTLQVRLAGRSLLRYKRRSLITVSSISLGLAFAIFYTAMHNGVNYRLFRQGTALYTGQIILQKPAYAESPSISIYLDRSSALLGMLKTLDGIEYLQRQIIGQGMARTAYDSQGVEIQGMETGAASRNSLFYSNLIAGNPLEGGREAQVLVGRKLAQRLRLDVGKKVILTTNDSRGDLVEELCRVRGIFATGLELPDGNLILVSLDFSRRLFSLPPDAVTRIGLGLKNDRDERNLLKRIRNELGGYPAVALSWKQALPELTSYLRVDRAANTIFLGILISVILFTLLNTVMMSVLERKHEFGLLLALGTHPSLIRLQLFWESFWLGLWGCMGGMVIGGGTAYYFQLRGLKAAWVYGEHLTISGLSVSPVIHARVTWELLLGAGGVMLALILLLSLLPMRTASVIEPARSLKQEWMG